jgi:hypothetical protein
VYPVLCHFPQNISRNTVICARGKEDVHIKRNWISYFPHHCNKTPNRNNLKGGRTYLGSKFHRSQSIMLGRVWCIRTVHILQARKESKGQEGTRARYSSQGHVPNDPLPTTKHHLLIFATSQCHHIMNTSRD